MKAVIIIVLVFGACSDPNKSASQLKDVDMVRRHQILGTFLSQSHFSRIVIEYFSRYHRLPVSQAELISFYNEDYRRHKDFWDSLSINQPCTDPFTPISQENGLLKYRLISKNECIIYSIGPDGIDQFGRIEIEVRGGRAFILNEDVVGDLVLRMTFGTASVRRTYANGETHEFAY